METIADRLVLARQRAGYEKAADAADAFGWTYSTYAGHENGSRGIKLATARGYARAFKVSLTWLLDGKGEPGPIKGEAKIIHSYREMSPEDRAILEAMAEQLASRKPTGTK